MNRNTKRAIDNIDATIAALQRVKRDLPELDRRTRHAASDGYPASSMSGPGQRGAISRPTESTALAKPMSDPVMQAMKSTLGLAAEIAAKASRMDGSRQMALELGESERGRQNSVPLCVNPACGAPCVPRPLAGRCTACYHFKRRTGEERQPDERTAG